MRASVSIACLFMLLIALGCSQASKLPSPDCPIHTGTCSRIVDDLGITLDILPKPVKVMGELDVYVRLDTQPGTTLPERVMLDLSMPGMYMGDNRVILRSSGKGLYSGKAVIPRCPSGGRLWSARIEAGSVSTAFLFEVEK